MLSYLEREVIFGNLISDIKDILIVEESLVGKRLSSDPSNFNKSPSNKPTNPYTKEEKDKQRRIEDDTDATNRRTKAMEDNIKLRRLEHGGESDTQTPDPTTHTGSLHG